jgi:Ca2+-binding RTX toxin-like protein
MPSPTSYGTIVTSITPASLGVGRFVADGEKWGGGLGTGVTLTYSFPGRGSIGNFAYWSDPYPAGGNFGSYGEWNGWFALNNAEIAGVKAALAVWSRFANITFQEVDDGQFNVGELRFTYSNELPANESAHAYFPFQAASGGDVWFNPQEWDTDHNGAPLGSFDFQTVLHEIGHALGLKHTFSTSNNGGGNLTPAGQDNFFYSIMSYTASPWSAHGDNFATFYPTTPMYYDLVAIETMYGRRAFNTGNNTYTFTDGVKYFQAIHDTAGSDTIIYNGVEATTIDLVPGHFSTLSESIGFHRPDGSTVFSRATVTIGPNVVIESAHGGDGNDLIIGNASPNILGGRGGNDSVRGGFGNDTLYGGAGFDKFLFNTAPNSSTNHDRVMDYVAANDTVQLENAVFTKFVATGALNASFFRANAVAVDGNDFLVYNRATGNLFYDINGNGAGGTQLIATFVNKPVLAASEFAII